jgi:hypothetical protein
MKKLIGALAISTTLLLTPSSANAQALVDNVCPTGNPASVSAGCVEPGGSGTLCVVWVYIHPLKRDDSDAVCLSLRP